MVHHTKCLCSLRANDCQILFSSDQQVCDSCSARLVSIRTRQKQSSAKKGAAIKAKAPISSSSKERLVATVKQQRLVCKELENRVTELEK